MTAEPDALRLVPATLGPLRFLANLAPLPLVDPTEAARCLDIERHSLACYRSLGEGPAYYKFGRWIRYARIDLANWRKQVSATPLHPLGEPVSDETLLVDASTAAHFLTITRSCLRSYRLDKEGPRFCRLRRRIHYPVGELWRWARSKRIEPQP